jgi:hypothetical protein
LVAQGLLQVPGVDYFDMYGPVAHLTSICTVLALAACKNMELHQINIKRAYLNGELTTEEVIYMCQPPGFGSPDHPNKVCQLQKTLYGLKQSGWRWYQRLIQILVGALNFTQCNVDQAVFYKCLDRNLTIIVVHIDDCMIVVTTIYLVVELKSKLHEHVEIMDLGELHWLLGIKIKWD